MRSLCAAVSTAAFLLLGTPAMAHPASGECKSLTMLMGTPAPATTKTYTGVAARVGIELYNSLPPVGHLSGDTVLLIPTSDHVAIVILRAGCVQDVGILNYRTAISFARAMVRAAVPANVLPATPDEFGSTRT